ncbi:HigA family addiction module antitoxin [Castellaniella sp.]|uniref:HigA family addiction module antitoxin n=1 Tax=Castellaniella sp. TaxID=1955812 RepID=UPI002D80AFCF|nr:HigA family addiction module antitoxin [Castellaniella sp.]HET8703211.1 HigA family addiction module antitoxin [Castellaniella sp.]
MPKAKGIPRRRINEIAQGNRAIPPDTAARLGAFFGVDAEGWLALQAHYDTEIVGERLGDVLSNIPPYDRIAHPPRASH